MTKLQALIKEQVLMELHNKDVIAYLKLSQKIKNIQLNANKR